MEWKKTGDLHEVCGSLLYFFFMDLNISKALQGHYSTLDAMEHTTSATAGLQPESDLCSL